MEVKFCLRGKHFVKDVCDTNEYGISGFQWRNILSVVSDCSESFPRFKHIDPCIWQAEDEELEDIGILEKIKESGKEWLVCLSWSDEDRWDNESYWIKAEDEEDAAKKALLELGYGEGEVIYIKDDFGNFIYGEDK